MSMGRASAAHSDECPARQPMRYPTSRVICTPRSLIPHNVCTVHDFPLPRALCRTALPIAMRATPIIRDQHRPYSYGHLNPMPQALTCYPATDLALAASRNAPLGKRASRGPLCLCTAYALLATATLQRQVFPRARGLRAPCRRCGPVDNRVYRTVRHPAPRSARAAAAEL